MSNLPSEANRIVTGFVTQITELAERSAIEMLQAAFRSRTAPSREIALGGTASPRAGRPRGAHGAKRSPQDLAALSTRFAAFVHAHPGLRVEQVNKQLGTTTAELALPIRKLIAEGAITTQGKRRATTYLPGAPSPDSLSGLAGSSPHPPGPLGRSEGPSAGLASAPLGVANRNGLDFPREPAKSATLQNAAVSAATCSILLR
jgi:hypothetical protein